MKDHKDEKDEKDKKDTKGEKGATGGDERGSSEIILTYKVAVNPALKTTIDKEQVLFAANDMENSLRDRLRTVSGVNSVEAIDVTVIDAPQE